jgi:hypothetical protein
MADYRLYCIDGAGRVDLAKWFAADSDEEAIGKARMMRNDGSGCELWHKSRLVAKLNADGAAEWLAS